MTTQTQTNLAFVQEQFRMTQLQVYNWGTFSGLHTIPIAQPGFLFTGQSGTGKSTLLDGFSTLLISPRWVDFNAAAREADRSGRDRNLVTYIRGAWTQQQDDDSGEIVTRYLRPTTTWSALALSYHNTLGQHVTLVQIFWLRGKANANTDVRRHYLIFEREFNLAELEIFSEANFDTRKLKQTFPEAFFADEFRLYCERFCRLLGIESEMALRLLHKTQSAKNLGDLNAFLRDFMLDKPETFQVADRLVNEFVELNAAHQAVVTVREQIQALEPAREQHHNLQRLQLQQNELMELRQGIDLYRDTRQIELLGEEINALTVRLTGLKSEASQRKALLANQDAALRDLERQHREQGGEQIEQWEIERQNLQNQRSERLRKRGQCEEACKQLGWLLPETPQAFAELVGKARQQLEYAQQDREVARDKQVAFGAEKRQVEANFAQTVKEVNALKRQPSNIPADMLELRKDIAEALGIATEALPFVGELIEVKAEEAPWRGAIERVLHGFALSMLVDDRHYSALAQYLDQTYLGKRLVYYRTEATNPWQAKPLANNSLVLKLNIKAGGCHDWLYTELRQRFDYACVDSLQAFKNTDRALTKTGQIKHNKGRHEKDDRNRVDDQRHWALGFNNREKLAIFEQQAQALADEIARLEREINLLAQQDNNHLNQVMQCQILVNLQWQELDVAPLLDRIAQLEQQLKAVREGSSVLAKLNQNIERQRGLVEKAKENLRATELNHDKILDKLTESQQKLAILQEKPTLMPLTPYQRQQLDQRFAQQADTVRLENLERLVTAVVQALSKEVEVSQRESASCEKTIENCFANFKRQWPLEAGDLTAELASAEDFLAKLARLEQDGLPAHEQRFFALLRNQSHQNLAALLTYLNDARKAIVERMDLVNDSLRQVPFNQSVNQQTYLRIEASDRQLVEVKEFKRTIQQALSQAWNDQPELAESRFLLLRQLVGQLSSQDPDQKRWRELVLDVRQHVEFIGREFDEHGVEVEIYRSGAGKSGGQRQKLATTCLAAALRYQLGGNDYGLPIYAPVVLDEAFDKADNEFTTLAMNIFTNFGFQMIIATPLKSVMTLEPFIGGACFVSIADRKVSSVAIIEYDVAGQKLKLPKQTYQQEDLA